MKSFDLCRMGAVLFGMIMASGLSSCSIAQGGGRAGVGEFADGFDGKSDGEGRGVSCHSSDPDQYCLAIKYVVYQDSRQNPVVSLSEAERNIRGINQVWSQCQIAFQIDSYIPVNPAANHLAFNTSDASELETIRRDYFDNSTLLVVTTGAWDRDGSLGDTGANAWTNMPGESVYGVVLESPVGTYSNIIAHELGHYLNLDHFESESNLMNPVIYDDSKTLSAEQCASARKAIREYWLAMGR